MSHISQKQFEAVNWLPIEERYNLCVNSTAFKYFDNHCPNYLNEVFIKASESSSLLRKSYQKRQQYSSKTSTGENAISFVGRSLWNKVP